jgi:hypothetical protein
VTYFKGVLGYMVTGHTSLETVFFNVGMSGANGKGMVCELLSKILGPLYFIVPVNLLRATKTARDPAAASSHLMRCRGSRAAVIDEVPDAAEWASVQRV